MRNGTHAFTLVELLVVMGIIALLISILLPALGKARQQASLTACSAQLKDFFNSVQMYTIDNKGYFPGPCVAQIRAGYKSNEYQITNYLYRYMKLPEPTSTYQIFKVLYCPGYRSGNAMVSEAELWTYTFQMWDPYPWVGYANKKAATYFPLYSEKRSPIVGGKWDGFAPPMKIGQVFSGSKMPMIADADNAGNIFEAGSSVSNQALSRVPNHGGKPETRQGVEYLANGPFIKWVDRKAMTNPPRNWLFMDGHVEVRRKSGTVLPPDFVNRYGPPPAGWSPPYLDD